MHERAECLLCTVTADFIASNGQGVGDGINEMKDDITCNSHRPWDWGWSADDWVLTRDFQQTLRALLGHGVVVMSETGIGAGSGDGWESIVERDTSQGRVGISLLSEFYPF